MPNCDFGGPCSCRDCRTVYKTIICPECAFPNVVSIERDARWEVDRKGMSYVDFTQPMTPKKDLVCYSCSAIIKGLDYFTESDDTACQHALDRIEAVRLGKGCSNCGKLEGVDYAGAGWLADKVRLSDDNGDRICQACLSDRIRARIPDPSSSSKKFAFDRRAMEWKLEKVKLPCEGCRKSRWIKAKYIWKKKCQSCYVKSQTM